MVAEGGEGENPLPFSLSPIFGNAGGGWGEGEGVGGVSRLRFRPGQASGAWTAALTGSLPASQVFMNVSTNRTGTVPSRAEPFPLHPT